MLILTIFWVAFAAAVWMVGALGALGYWICLRRKWMKLEHFVSFFFFLIPLFMIMAMNVILRIFD